MINSKVTLGDVLDSARYILHSLHVMYPHSNLQRHGLNQKNFGAITKSYFSQTKIAMLSAASNQRRPKMTFPAININKTHLENYSECSSTGGNSVLVLKFPRAGPFRSRSNLTADDTFAVRALQHNQNHFERGWEPISASCSQV